MNISIENISSLPLIGKAYHRLCPAILLHSDFMGTVQLLGCRHSCMSIVRFFGSTDRCKFKTLSANCLVGEPLLISCSRCSSIGVKSAIFLATISSLDFDILSSLRDTFNVRRLFRSLHNSYETCAVFLRSILDDFTVNNSGLHLVLSHLYRHIILHEAMCWLCTLGGGFSSLGYKFSDAAEIAGLISRCQLKLASAMEMPAIQAKCNLWFALSLMQLGYLNKSVKIVRGVYEYQRRAPPLENPPEMHLHDMCRGLWRHLQYMWQLRRAKKGKGLVSALDSLNASSRYPSTSEFPPDNDEYIIEHREFNTMRLFKDVTAVITIL